MRGVNRDINVLHVDIMLEPNGRSKGCALVEYARCGGRSSRVSRLGM
jgi:hypothetical protein